MKWSQIKYNDYKSTFFEKRYLPSTLLEKWFKTQNISSKIIGLSFLEKNIYLLSSGSGRKHILFWSQMHGNETTATRALIDIFNFLNSSHPIANKITSSLTIDWIPQLNPDGADAYTRRNAMNIDLNRDFSATQSPEIEILKNLVSEKDYEFLFNMHDQRSIFHPENSILPATLSFLSPSFNESREINSVRKKAMQLIATITDEMQEVFDLGIARFSDEFYPKATGDNFQQMGIPTILIESGHFPNDYERQKTREYTFYAIISALNAIAEEHWTDKSIIDYNKIPQNANNAYDLIFRNVGIKHSKQNFSTDLGIIFHEIIKDDSLHFISKIDEIGDLSSNFGYVEHDFEHRIFNSKKSNIPEVGMIANFKIGEIEICNAKMMNNP